MGTVCKVIDHDDPACGVSSSVLLLAACVWMIEDDHVDIATEGDMQLLFERNSLFNYDPAMRACAQCWRADRGFSGNCKEHMVPIRRKGVREANASAHVTAADLG